LVIETACGLHNWRLDFRLSNWTALLFTLFAYVNYYFR
jgi:hypothetical protein